MHNLIKPGLQEVSSPEPLLIFFFFLGQMSEVLTFYHLIACEKNIQTHHYSNVSFFAF